jgi:hypothetical protein
VTFRSGPWSVASGVLSSCAAEPGAGFVLVDVPVDRGQCGGQIGKWLDWSAGQQTVVQLGMKAASFPPLGGQDVAVGVLVAADQPGPGGAGRRS